MKRSTLKSIYNQRYKTLAPVSMRNTNKCFYCGLQQEVEDHFPPLGHADCFDVNDPIDWLLVPSCKECNSIAADSLQRDIFERGEQIRESIQRRYGAILRRAGKWTDEEIEKLSEEDPENAFISDLRDLKEVAREAESRIAFGGFGFDVF